MYNNEKYKNSCPLDHSTFEKFIECDCNYAQAIEIWYYKEQEIKNLRDNLLGQCRISNDLFKEKDELLKLLITVIPWVDNYLTDTGISQKNNEFFKDWLNKAKQLTREVL